MDQEFFKSLSDWMSLPFALVVAVVWMLLAWWLWERTGTPSIFMARLWQLLAGTGRKEGSSVDTFILQHNELMELRFRFFPKMRNLQQFEKVQQWMDKKGLDVADVAACGSLFDLEKLEPKAKSRQVSWAQWIIASIAAMATVLTVALVALAASDRWFIQVKETRNFYSVLPDRAIGLSGQRTVLKRSCKDATRASEKMPQKDREVLCQLLNTPDIEQDLKLQVSAQRAISLLFAVMLTWLAGQGYWWLRRWHATSQLTLRLGTQSAS
jgi:Family of unknown function (DUF6216)